MSILIPESLRLQDLNATPSAGNFQFGEILSKDLAKDLTVDISENAITLVLNSKPLNTVYRPIVERLISQHMTILKLRHVIISSNLEQMAASIIYVVVAQLLHPKSVTKEISVTRSRLYNNLSRYFALLRKDLRHTPANLSEQLLEFWCSSVCAMLLILLVSKDEHEELHNNVFFVTRIEQEVHRILIGPSMVNPISFHSIVVDLLPYDIASLIPADLTADDETIYVKDCSTRQPRRAKLFTPTILHSMMSSRSNIPVKPQGPSEKADKIVLNVKQIVGKHKIKTQQSLNVIRLCERDYLDGPNMTTGIPVAVSFDSFAPESYKKSHLPKRPRKLDIEKMNAMLDSALVNLHGSFGTSIDA